MRIVAHLLNTLEQSKVVYCLPEVRDFIQRVPSHGRSCPGVDSFCFGEENIMSVGGCKLGYTGREPWDLGGVAVRKQEEPGVEEHGSLR